MTTLNNIEELLEININDYRLRDGKNDKTKNKYYWKKGEWYVIKLSKDKDQWIIMDSNQRTRDLLTERTWGFKQGYANAKYRINGVRKDKLLHHYLQEFGDGMMVDHINRNRFDNRSDNLREATRNQNNRNKTTYKNNASGKQGVSHIVRKDRPYWRSRIKNTDGKLVENYFSVNKLGEAQAKRLAIAKRKELEILYGYTGE